MTSEQAISLYLKLTNDIHAYWGAFGALVTVIVGWLLSRKERPSLSQRIALTVGWFAAGGYLASSLMNRYQLVYALSQDLSGQTLNVLNAVANLGPLYKHYEEIVWLSFGLISLAAIFLIWSHAVFGGMKNAG